MNISEKREELITLVLTLLEQGVIFAEGPTLVQGSHVLRIPVGSMQVMLAVDEDDDISDPAVMHFHVFGSNCNLFATTNGMPKSQALMLRQIWSSVRSRANSAIDRLLTVMRGLVRDTVDSEDVPVPVQVPEAAVRKL